MKIQQLEYIIAIAQAGSITAAAKNLHQAQPNISIALRDLETEIGMQIFWRTPNGMVLTPEGETFLLRAKDIVESMQTLESDYTNRTNNSVSLKIASARSSYIASVIGEWIKTISSENKINISIMGVMTNGVIDCVGSGKADTGIIRVPKGQLDVYIENLTNRKLSYKKLMDFKMELLMRHDNPLAQYDDVPFDELKKYTEIVHGDDEINLFGRTFINKEYENDNDHNRIFVHDIGNKIVLLDTLPNTYMWTAPTTSGNIIAPDYLVTRKCSYANIDISDIVIFKKSAENNRIIKDFTGFITEYTKNMSEKHREK